MVRICVLAGMLALSTPVLGAASLYSDLYGKSCRVVDTDPASGATTRRCTGVAGYSLLVHEARAQTSVDVVSPAGAIYPLQYWDVVTPGLARVGRKAEWRVERRNGRVAPTALLVRLDVSNEMNQGPRVAPGAMITAARIAADGACVVYFGDGVARSADEKARQAVAQRDARCLGVLNSRAGN